MARKIVMSSLVFLICLFTVGSGADEPEKRVMNIIAVMDLKCGKGMDKALSAPLTDVVIEELVKIGKYTVVNRADRDKILREQEFQCTAYTDEGCSVEIGRILGAGKMVVGSIAKIGNTYQISLQLINVETANIEVAASERCKKCEVDDLFEVAGKATRKLMGQAPISTSPDPQPIPPVGQTPRPEEIKFIAATPEQQKLCPANMVYVPAGWFMMGCNSAKDSQCQADEHPYHAVYLDAYCIDKYEYPNQSGATPKRKVNWNDAQGICSSQGKRLPTEAQWEKAARGTDGRVYPWGDYMDKEKKKALKKKYNSGAYSWNVSPYGAYDMSASLWEWCADWYDATYYNVSPNRNPTGPTSGKYRVLRGGSRTNGPRYWRSSYGNVYYPNGRSSIRGFRCARTL